MVSTTLILTGILFLVVSLLFGVGRGLQALPALFFLMLMVSLFGFVLIKFFPLIVILIVIAYMRNRNAPKKRTTFYYRTFTQEDFEDMFRNQGGGSYSSGGGYQNTGFNNYFEDKSKYYRVLGVSESATQDEIKKAFRDLAKIHHPDKYSSADEATRERHEKKFKEINEAYEKLKEH